MTLEVDINRQDYSDFNKHHFVKTRLTRTIITGVLTILILEWFLNKDTFDMTATALSATVCGLVYVFLIYRQLQNTKNIPKDKFLTFCFALFLFFLNVRFILILNV
jgi:hypothetical protein